MSENRTKLTKFKKYVFAKTATVSGAFNKLDMLDKNLVKDSNFKFKSIDRLGNTLINITNFDDMFNGCVNATFSHSIVIGNDVEATSAKRMFKGCSVAKIPHVDITYSNLKQCDEMFSGCENAILDGVDIPKNAESIKAMFKNCKKCAFLDISSIKNTITDFTEIFYGCENGVFGNLRLPSPDGKKNIDRYNFNHAFYDCGSLESNTMKFENIAEYTSNADFMFYNAGGKSSSVFDDKILNFGNIQTCTSMFENSNFEFENTYVQFYSNGSQHKNYHSENNINSITRMFYGTENVKDRLPVVILSDNDVYTAEDAEKSLNRGFAGHYKITNSDTINGITDFSYLYANSNAKTVDFRGISYNSVIDNSTILNNKSIQNFKSMLEGCENLENIKGHIPPNASTYESMFSGCSNLSIDIGEAFKKQPINWSGNINELEIPSKNGERFENYKTKSINSMFYGCDKIYSRNDEFDLVSLVKTVKNNTNQVKTPYENAFSKIKIATKNPVAGLELVDYDITNISENTGIIRYNSFEDEQYDINKGSISEFGIYSDYMKYMFTKGFYRFGGYFKSDNTKYFCVMYRPLIDVQSGDVINFYIESKIYSNNFAPHGFSDTYNIDKSKGYWSEVRFDSIYAAKIFNTKDNSFVKNAYVGSYTRIYNEKRTYGGDSRVVSTEIEMPVTYFDSLLGEEVSDL